MKSADSLKAIFPVALVATVVLLLFAGALNQAHTRALHLGNVTSRSCSFTVVCPQGDSFSVVFGVPTRRRFPESGFSGEVRIRQGGTTVLVLPFQRSNLFETNWLDSEGLGSCAIRIPPDGEKGLKPGEELVIALELSGEPPSDLTLWLNHNFSGWDALRQSMQADRDPPDG